MIEKFTAEELKIIRKEISEMDRQTTKDLLLKEQFQRALKVLHFNEGKSNGGSFSTFEVKSALTLLIDHALNNYMKNEKKHDFMGRTMWKRNPSVPSGMEEKYLAAYTRIVDALEESSEPWPEGASSELKSNPE